MSANTYIVGKVAKLLAAFTLDGVATDPTTVAVTVRRPDGIKQTYVYGTDVQVVRDSQGNYRLNYTPVVAGPHWHYWVSTGTAATAGEVMFIVAAAHGLE